MIPRGFPFQDSHFDRSQVSFQVFEQAEKRLAEMPTTTPQRCEERRPEKGGCVVWQHGLYGKTGKNTAFLQHGDWSEGLTAKLDFDYIITSLLHHHESFDHVCIMYLTMSQMMCVQNWDETWSLRVNLTAGPRKIWRWARCLRGAQRPLGEG